MVDLEFGLIVTGESEEGALHGLFRALFETGLCSVKIHCRIGQLGPRKEKPPSTPKLPGNSIGRVPRRDEELAQKCRNWLCDSENGWQPRPRRRLVLFDDLESARVSQVEMLFFRYREAVDLLLTESLKPRVAVHFLANMLEAYFWADPRGLEEHLGLNVSNIQLPADPEEIPHPKNLIQSELQKLKSGRSYREVDHGTVLIGKLDLAEVLKDPTTCGYLRAALGWMVDSLERVTTQPEVLAYFQLRQKFQLDHGLFARATAHQLVAEPDDGSEAGNAEAVRS